MRFLLTISAYNAYYQHPATANAPVVGGSPLQVGGGGNVKPRTDLTVIPLEAYGNDASSSLPYKKQTSDTHNGWKTAGKILVATLVGVPLGLMAGEWSWRSRLEGGVIQKLIAQKLEKNKQCFLQEIPPFLLSDDQKKNIGKIGGLTSTLSEIIARKPDIDNFEELNAFEKLQIQMQYTRFQLEVEEHRSSFKELDDNVLKLIELETGNISNKETTDTSVVADGLEKIWDLGKTEVSPKAKLAWLLKGENYLLEVDTAGNLVGFSQQAKLIAAVVAGGVIGGGIALLNLLEKKSPTETDPALTLQQPFTTQGALPVTFKPDDTLAEKPLSSSPQKRPTKPSNEIPLPAPQQETVQAFWEKRLRR